MRLLVLGLILVSMLSLGCIFQSETNITNNTTAPPPPPPPPKPASFSIASPTSGQTILVSAVPAEVTLTLTTQNLILKTAGGTKKAGEGHFQVTVDDGTPTPYASKTVQLTGLAAGEHTVKVELLNNDRTPYSGQSPKSVTFTIEKEKPPEYVPVTHTVSIKDFSYEPATITIKRTDSIKFENTGAFPRDATCFIGGVQKFDTKVIQPGSSATLKFDEVFECQFYSSLHMLMKGTIKIVPNDVDAQ